MCRLLLLTALGVLGFAAPAGAQQGATYDVGVAKIDVTPDYPVRLSGFGFRRAESEGVTQRIWAKALAIGGDGSEPAVVIAVDTLGVPVALVREVAARLEKKAGLKKDRLAVTATHTHTAPMLAGVAPTLYSQPIPPDHQKRIDRYTAELTDSLEKVALAALKDRQPAKLSYGVGKVTFAINRRTKGGPVDHDLPALVVRDLRGKVRAVWVTYACHCVTLSNNKVSGDWAGFASELIEADHPGAVGLVSVGCGADSNPSSGVTGDKADVARGQGAAVAREARRVAQAALAPVSGKLEVRWKTLELPLDTLPTREEWEKKAKRTDAIGHHARVNLARLDRREELKTKIDYPIQVLSFGESLAVAFLPGEVVVDYALRLKKELDGSRLWICAYSNDAPCYIPSERILKEGGYEGGGAMVYYDLPTRLAPGLEDKIIGAVRELAGDKFKPAFDPKKVQVRPLSPQQSLAEIKTRPEMRVELVAAEPLVTSPVAVAFGPDGKLWVCEMYDYPSRVRGDYKPGGRVKVLEDTDGDGKFDKATVFLDNIPFPTGVTVWRKGVLVCAAPDILHAEDTDGDGKADKVRKLFSGFGTENYQARVNSLEYGLDGWVYGSCGLFGGKITNFNGKTFDLGDRDFRIKPDTGELEPATGRTQQGRVRDDWGNWFGCDNSNLCRHYPLADHYLRRNPHVAPPPAFVNVPAGPDPNKLYPLRTDLQLFKLSGPPGRTTGACGLGIYRDDLLGKDVTGNAFVCEPVNLLVHRLVLTPRGSTFEGKRAKGEEKSEFLASTDPWFRPVQVTTGPDGALWVVDMYRYVIEHPRWIPPEELAKVDLRAGSTMGRIYRVVPKDGAARPWTRLDKLDTEGLVKALDSPNGWQRDMASQMLLWRGDTSVLKALGRMAIAHQVTAVANTPRAEARLHALCVLDGLGGLGGNDPFVRRYALNDEHLGVRRHAIRLCDRALQTSDRLHAAFQQMFNFASDPQTLLQLACTLGEWGDARAGQALARLGVEHSNDPYMTAAVLSSIRRENVADVIASVFARGAGGKPPDSLLVPLLRAGAALGDHKALAGIVRRVTASEENVFEPWQMVALASILEVLERRGQTLDQLKDEEVREQVRGLLAAARTTAENGKAPGEERQVAVALLGREAGRRDGDMAALARLLGPEHSPALQSAAIAALGRIPDGRAASILTTGWKNYAPALKSQALDVLLRRNAWQRHLLAAVGKGDVPAAHIDATRRQRLLSQADAKVRELAAKLFGATSADRQKVLDAYAAAVKLKGDRERGKAIYAKSCAACHRLGDAGHAVGPDLAAVVGKTPQYLLIEILDPNRNVDTRYVEYAAVAKDGRLFSGVLASETAVSVTLRGQEGKDTVLLRNELDVLRSSGKSLMPEGLEKEISQQDMADLLVYLAPAGPDDAASVARRLLDVELPDEKKRSLIESNLGIAAEVLAALTADFKPGTKAEYLRIPLLWRVSFAAGKQNDAAVVRKVLAVALPKEGEPLHHWQAVVLGGGVVNGISLKGGWPGRRIDELMKDDKGLKARWSRSLGLAYAMADDAKVPSGTRYDALRMIALDDWKRCREQLTKYLAKDAHPELQMGAVSGVGDAEAKEAGALLLKHLGGLTPGNRKLALDALLRTNERVGLLLGALEGGSVNRTVLSPEQVRALRDHADADLRARARKLLP